MSVTAGAPPTFYGMVKNSNDNNIHVVADTGGHEAMIAWSHVKSNASRPCKLGYSGMVKIDPETGITFTPDRI